MIAGLSLAAWLLILTSVGIGLAIELVFFAAHRRRDDPDDTDRAR